MATLTKSTGTVTLSGAVEKVTFPAVYGWVWVKNMSDADMFVGLSEGVSAGADGVLAIPTGECGRVQTDGQDSVYLLGSGNALVVAQNYADCPFKVGGKGGEIPDLSAYAKTADVPNIKVNEAVNADTVGGIQAADFRQITRNAIQTLPTPPIAECDYFVSSADLTFPYPFGNLSIRYGSYTGEFVAIYQTTGTDQNVWFNVYRGNWVGWRRINDGGNADTVGELHSNDFVRRYGKNLLSADYVSTAAMDTDYKGVINSETANSIGLDGSSSCWWHIVGLKNFNDDGYGAQLAIPMFPNSSTQNPKYRTSVLTVFQPWIDIYTGSNKPYVTGEITFANPHGEGYTNSPVPTNHGFMPSKILYWPISTDCPEELYQVYSAVTFDETSFTPAKGRITMDSSTPHSFKYQYIIFK